MRTAAEVWLIVASSQCALLIQKKAANEYLTDGGRKICHRIFLFTKQRGIRPGGGKIQIPSFYSAGKDEGRGKGVNRCYVYRLLVLWLPDWSVPPSFLISSKCNFKAWNFPSLTAPFVFHSSPRSQGAVHTPHPHTEMAVMHHLITNKSAPS